MQEMGITMCHSQILVFADWFGLFKTARYEDNSENAGICTKLTCSSLGLVTSSSLYINDAERCEGRNSRQIGEEARKMDNKPMLKLRKAAQPPLSYPGAPPDSDRAKKPPLVDPSAADQELNPGDRVEGLGNFGKPTGELGTVERTNEEDAVVKWDGDGRMRIHQPFLKKI